MKKSRYNEEQIAFALKQAELGTKVEEVCRQMGVSQATFFRWKQLYGGLGIDRFCYSRPSNTSIKTMTNMRPSPPPR
jgi:Transposase